MMRLRMQHVTGLTQEDLKLLNDNKWLNDPESCVPCKPGFQGIQALSFSREDIDNLCEWIDYAISFTQHTLSHATAHFSRQRQYLSTEGRVPYG